MILKGNTSRSLRCLNDHMISWKSLFNGVERENQIHQEKSRRTEDAKKKTRTTQLIVISTAIVLLLKHVFNSLALG